MRANLAVAAAAVAVVAFLGSAQAASSTSTIVEYGGVLRCTNGVWSALNDAGHQSQGIGKLTATTTYLEVEHVHVDKVLSAIYTGDNDYPRFGIVVTGASGSFNYDRVMFYKNGALINPAAACDLRSTNLWVDGRGWSTS